MGLYNFKPQFAPKVESGAKTHTIRGKRKHADKPGNTLYLYTGARTKACRLLGYGLCTRVQDILIELDGAIYLDDTRLEQDEAEQLARRDGFASHAEMLAFWKGRLPFTGDILHWKFLGKVQP